MLELDARPEVDLDPDIMPGQVVVYEGQLSQREGTRHRGILARVRDDGSYDVLIVAPGRTWTGALQATSDFRWVHAPADRVQPDASYPPIGARVLFRAAVEDYTQSTIPTFRSPEVSWAETVQDERYEDRTRTVVRRQPGEEGGKRTVVRGSKFHREMTTFAGIVVGIYEDSSARDLILLVPGKLSPTLVKHIFSGGAEGTYEIWDEV